MPDPNSDPNPKPDENKDQGGTPKPEEIEALKRKNAELIAEKRKADAKLKELSEKAGAADTWEQRLTKVGEVLGIDLKKGDPDALKREQEERLKAENDRQRAESARTSAIERTVLLKIAASGKALDEEIVEMVVGHAKASKVVQYDPETGKVEGIEDYLTKVLEKFGGAGAGDQRVKNPPIGKPEGGGGTTLPAKFANVKTFQQLVEMGETARAEYERANPALYAALRAANVHSARTPAHTVAPPPQR